MKCFSGEAERGGECVKPIEELDEYEEQVIAFLEAQALTLGEALTVLGRAREHLKNKGLNAMQELKLESVKPYGKLR